MSLVDVPTGAVVRVDNPEAENFNFVVVKRN